MKKITTLLLGFTALCAVVLLESNAGGAALVQKADRTGGPLSDGPCQVCHSSGLFNPSIDIQVQQNGMTVDAYQPGEVYTLRVQVNATPNAQQFGFQAVALSGPDDLQAGSFQNAPLGVAVRTVDGREYPEQSFPSLNDTFTVEWVAPLAGTGDVRFYAAGVATNGNGNSAGDGGAFSNLTLPEADPSSVADVEEPTLEILQLVPGQSVTVRLPDATGRLSIFDLSGRPAWSLDRAMEIQDVPLDRLPAGPAILSWSDGQRRAVLKVWIP